MTVRLPTTLNRYSLPGFFAELDATRDHPDVAVDFSPLKFSMPTGTLVAGSKLREWIGYRHANGYISTGEGIDGKKNQVHSYFKHLGFFDYIGMEDQGNRVGEARGGQNFIPIRRIARPNIDVPGASLEEWDGAIERWYAALEEEARLVAGVLAGSFDDSQALRTYKYSIREILRNVFEHSQANECFVLGQRWINGHVEIAIVDEGVGIGHTLSESHGTESDADALQMAVLPGISRTAGNNAGHNAYDNSGFGLYILSELGANFGWFTIGSGTAFLYGYKRTRAVGPGSFRGTFFGVHFNAAPFDISSVLNDIIEAGEREAQAAGIQTRASGRSRIAM